MKKITVLFIILISTFLYSSASAQSKDTVSLSLDAKVVTHDGATITATIKPVFEVGGIAFFVLDGDTLSGRVRSWSEYGKQMEFAFRLSLKCSKESPSSHTLELVVFDRGKLEANNKRIIQFTSPKCPNEESANKKKKGKRGN